MTSLDPPATLDPETAGIWAETLDQLERAGTLRYADPNSLHAYASAVRTHRHTDALIQQTGELINRDRQPVPNPALAIRDNAARTIALLARQWRLNRAAQMPAYVGARGIAQVRDSPARWCEAHGRWECTGQRSKGRGQCHNAAPYDLQGRPLPRCRNHLGKSLADARAERELDGWTYVPGDDSVSPGDVVLAQMGVAQRRAVELTGRLRRQAQGQQAAPGGGEGGFNGGDGLVGHVMAASEVAGGLYPSREAERVLAQMERAERKLAVEFADVAHRMGIEGRQADVQEQMAGVFLRLVEAVFDRLGLPAEQVQQAMTVVVPQVLRELAA